MCAYFSNTQSSMPLTLPESYMAKLIWACVHLCVRACMQLLYHHLSSSHIFRKFHHPDPRNRSFSLLRNICMIQKIWYPQLWKYYKLILYSENDKLLYTRLPHLHIVLIEHDNFKQTNTIVFSNVCAISGASMMKIKICTLTLKIYLLLNYTLFVRPFTLCVQRIYKNFSIISFVY